MIFGTEQLEFMRKKNYLNGKDLKGRISEIKALVKRYEDQYSEGLADRIEDLIERRVLSPSTPQWANLGKEKVKGTSPLPVSCYITAPTDSIQGIYYALGETAMMSKLGGGVGADFSNLSDKGSFVEEGFYTNSKLDWIEDLVGASQKVSQGCYDDQTEILTEDGWKFFKELPTFPNLKVAQVNDDESVEFVTPSEYFEYDVDEDLILFKDKKNINLLVTKNHNMVYKQEKRVIVDGKYKRFVKESFYVKTADDCPLHRDVKYLHSGFSKNGSGLTFMERLLIAFQADGSKVKKCKNSMRFRFSKKRKSDRLRWILDELGLVYSYNFIETDQTHNIYVNVGQEYSKDFSWVNIVDKSQQWCDEFLMEVSNWDASAAGDNGFIYSSIKKINVDVIQSICSICGYKSYISLDERTGEPNKKPIYKLGFFKGNYFGVEKINKELVHYIGKVYCVEVPSHKLIVRRGGRTVVCGNSQRRGYSVPFISIDDAEFYDLLERCSKSNPNKEDPLVSNNVGITLPIGFKQRITDGDKEAQKRFLKCLSVRESTGKLYLLDIENCNKNQSPIYKALGHQVCSTNICTEVLTPKYDDKSFVCVIASLNAVHWDEIASNPQIIKDALMFLDINVSEFIRLTEGVPFMEKARRSAIEKRDVGLGLLGFHEYIQSKDCAFGDIGSKIINREIFSTMRKYCEEATIEMAAKLGSPKLCVDAGIPWRNVSLMMVAPNKSTSFLCETSLGVEPELSNYYVKSLAGIQSTKKNKRLTYYLDKHGKNTQEVWDSILNNLGSAQHLDFLSKEEKAVVKTFSEISPKDIIDLASERQPFIDMSQSINLCNRPNYTKQDIYQIHKYAFFEKDLKTLYYYYPQAHAALERQGEKWDTCESCAD